MLNALARRLTKRAMVWFDDRFTVVCPEPSMLVQPTERANFHKLHLAGYDCRCLLSYVDADNVTEFQHLGFADGRDFCLECLGLDEAELEAVLGVLRARAPGSGPITWPTALRRAGLQQNQRSVLPRVMRMLGKLTAGERQTLRKALDETPR